VVFAYEVLSSLITTELTLPSGSLIELIEHRVSSNWRQRYTQPRERALAIRESLIHESPYAARVIDVNDSEQLRAEMTSCDKPDVALSVTSRVLNTSGKLVGHMALMNLHPEGFETIDELRHAVHEVTGHSSGYLIHSGRYFHYYGRRLLTETEWQTFIGEFLMPCTMVSPRYIGHSLARGYCSLRLTAAPPVKPATPTLVCSI
jgi:hypothetical protein